MSWRTAAVAALLLVSAHRSAHPQTQQEDTTARAVDRLFDPWRGTDSPGCAVGVSRGGETVFERGYGMANLETGTPIRPGTIFHAASLAKQVTAMAVMLLVRDGKLSLDDDVRGWVPELPDYGHRITLRHLLTHTSGVRDYFELLIMARGQFEEDRISDADVLDVLGRQKALNFTPGDEYLYSNSGYALAEIIVRRATGQTLRDFAAERIFAPLAMASTHFHDDYTMVVPGRASGYARRGAGWRTSAPNYDVYGATSLFTTVGDLLRWSANLDHPRVGDTAMVRMMSTSAVLANGDSTGYGFGLSLADDRGERVVEHEGSDPGFRSWMGRYPAHGLAVAVLCNTRSLNPVWLGHQVAALYLGPRPDPPTPANATASPAGDVGMLERRAGIYFNPITLEVVRLAVRDGRLFNGSGTELVPSDSTHFVLAGRPVGIRFEARAHSDYVAYSLVPGRHPVRFEWKAPVTLSPRELAAYTGDYWSEELASRYRVIATDSTLVLRTGTSEGMTARAVFADAFVSGQYTIRFTRRGREIAGFEITHPRARRISFARVARRAIP